MKYATVSIEKLAEHGIAWEEVKPNTFPVRVFPNVAHAIVHNGDRFDKKGIVIFSRPEDVPEGIAYSRFECPVDYLFWREFEVTTARLNKARV